MPDKLECEESDEIIMRRFCESLDERVFHALAARYYDSALRVARERLGNESLAQDAVQETLIRIVRHCKRYDATKPFAQWFYTVLRNTCTDLYRKEARQQKALDALAQSDFLPGGLEPDEPVRARVLEMVAELPRSDAEILWLRFVDDFSFKEIGTRLNCSLEAAKKRVQRLLKRLKS